MSASNVVSLAAARARAEGWEELPHGQVDFSVFDCGDGRAEVRLVTGSAAADTLQVHAVQVCESTLDALIEKATKTRDAMRARRAGHEVG